MIREKCGIDERRRGQGTVHKLGDSLEVNEIFLVPASSSEVE